MGTQLRNAEAVGIALYDFVRFDSNGGNGTGSYVFNYNLLGFSGCRVYTINQDSVSIRSMGGSLFPLRLRLYKASDSNYNESQEVYVYVWCNSDENSF